MPHTNHITLLFPIVLSLQIADRRSMPRRQSTKIGDDDSPPHYSSLLSVCFLSSFFNYGCFVSFISCTLLLVLYMVETIAKPPETTAGLAAGALTTFLFAVLCIRFVPCWANA